MSESWVQPTPAKPVKPNRFLGLRGKLSWLKKNYGVYLFILPALVMFLTFCVYPILYSFVMSFTNWQLVGTSKFIGLHNYLQIFTSEYVGIAFRNALIYGVISVPLQMALGLLIAIILDQPLRGRSVFRILYYLPVISSWVVVSILFEYLFNTDYGLVNWILISFHLSKDGIAWLDNPLSALTMLSLLGAWKGIGWAMLMFLAGLQSVPIELYEASSIDGAGRWQQFLHITIPGIRNVTLFILVLLTIGAFNVFISVFIITGGGPDHQTEVPLDLMYNAAFRDMDFGYASAFSYFMAVLIIGVSIIQMKIFPTNRAVGEE